MSKYYDNFNTKQANVQSIIHLINLLLKENLIGVEVGVFRAVSFCTLLQQCPNIKHLYGIDYYIPSLPGTAEDFIMDEKDAEFYFMLAQHNIKFSGYQEKATLIREDSAQSVKRFEDESLDFVFLDRSVLFEHYEQDLNDWYPKVKKGGLFSGHDWDTLGKDLVPKFLEEKAENQKISVFDNVWVLQK